MVPKLTEWSGSPQASTNCARRLRISIRVFTLLLSNRSTFLVPQSTLPKKSHRNCTDRLGISGIFETPRCLGEPCSLFASGDDDGGVYRRRVRLAEGEFLALEESKFCRFPSQVVWRGRACSKKFRLSTLTSECLGLGLMMRVMLWR
jgi:hypothetical protein